MRTRVNQTPQAEARATFGRSKTCRRATIIVLFAAFPVAAQQQTTPKTSRPPVPKRDLSGLWHYQSTGASEPVAPDNLIPPMTPWAQARFDAEKPGYGSRRAPGGDDPILECDPMGFPRVMFLNTPFEFVQVAGRMIQFFEHEHEYRAIWTDGRTLPTDADPTWYGYAVGQWETDDIFVVESTGFRDSTSFGPPITRTAKTCASPSAIIARIMTPFSTTSRSPTRSPTPGRSSARTES